MNYTTATDQEISLEIARLIPLPADAQFTVKSRYCLYNAIEAGELDYCNNWGDMGPLIEEDQIAVMPDSNGTWKAGSLPSPMTFGWANHTMGHTNPLRAAAICWLMINTDQ